jgi:Flp pilus assembly protein TadG
MASKTRNFLGEYMRGRLAGERGAFLVIFALMLLVILGFTALGVEAGRWYLVRAELAKGVDAAALAAARNISNPCVDNLKLAEEFGVANFYGGYMGTPGLMEGGTVQFTATMTAADSVQVEGRVHAKAILARIFGFDAIPVRAVSVAQKKDVEIMMILDRSGSMGQPMDKINNLKTAAKNFLSFFVDTQAQDRVGLISFAATALMDLPLGNNFVAPMTTAINAMTPYGGTNMEEAFELTGGPGGLPDQSTLPAGSLYRQQFVVFFSDGMPTALTDKFKYNNVVYDKAVVSAGGQYYNGVLMANCRPVDYPYMTVNNYLVKPNAKITKQSEWDAPINRYGDKANVTGDGKSASTSACGGETTKWYLFEKNPVPGYTAESCNIPNNYGGPLVRAFCPMARQLTFDNAQVLKNRNVKIYVVGLGTSQQLDENFLKSLSSGQGFAYFTTDPKDLDAIFKKIAKEIKLRLVE